MVGQDAFCPIIRDNCRISCRFHTIINSETRESGCLISEYLKNNISNDCSELPKQSKKKSLLERSGKKI